MWRAAKDAKSMKSALESALDSDSTCTDCLLGLGIFNLSHAPAGEDDEEHHMLASAQLYCQQMEFEPAS